MQKIGSTKYLQLPASNDIGKPSPLAMLAATCQRIGAPSPARASMRRRSSTPVASPVAEPTQVVVKTEVRSPSPAPVRELPAPKSVVAETKLQPTTTSLQVKVPSPDYRLPLTPPTTPTSSIETSSSPPPRVPSIPVAAPSTSPHAAYSYVSDHPAAVSEYPCHLGLPLHHQPVLHAPSLRYSPYTVVVPSSSHPSHVHDISPFAGYAGQVCFPPHTPVAPPCGTIPMAALPPVYYQSPYVMPAAAAGAPLVASPFQFGTYLHHELPASTASHCGKIRARPAHAKSPSTTERRSTAYDITRLLKKHEIDEDIDVVSV